MNQVNTDLKHPTLFCEEAPEEHDDDVGNDGTRLIINRHLGYKAMQPGAGQWKLITDPREECWYRG